MGRSDDRLPGLWLEVFGWIRLGCPRGAETAKSACGRRLERDGLGVAVHLLDSVGGGLRVPAYARRGLGRTCPFRGDVLDRASRSPGPPRFRSLLPTDSADLWHHCFSRAASPRGEILGGLVRLVSVRAGGKFFRATRQKILTANSWPATPQTIEP